MIDIIFVTNTVFKVNIVVNGCNYIINCYVLRDEVAHILLKCRLDVIKAFILCENALKYRIVYVFRNSECFCFLLRNIDIACNVNHHIGENFNSSLLNKKPYIRNCSILDSCCSLFCDEISRRCDNLTCCGIHNIISKSVSGKSVFKMKLLIKLITSNLSKIISSRVKKHSINKALRAVN